jgi:hypothetical protein
MRMSSKTWKSFVDGSPFGQRLERSCHARRVGSGSLLFGSGLGFVDVLLQATTHTPEKLGGYFADVGATLRFGARISARESSAKLARRMG